MPFVVVIERSTGLMMRALKIEGGGRTRGGHSAEELKLIVSSSPRPGSDQQEDMIHRVLDLETVVVREIMVPRNDIVSIDVEPLSTRSCTP